MMDCKDLPFEYLAGREWLVTNGLGAYASASLCGANTCRYHGLLIAAINPPVDRKIFLAKVEETVFWDEQDYPLSANQYPDLVYPRGNTHLSSFTCKPLPQTVYQIGQCKISKTVFMVQHSNTTIIVYQNLSGQNLKLSLNPLFNYRDFHKLNQEQLGHTYHYTQNQNTLRIKANNKSEDLYFSFSQGDFIEDRSWYKNIEYEGDKKRGTEFWEDYYSLGAIQVELMPGKSLYLTASLDPKSVHFDPENLFQAERDRLHFLTRTSVQDVFFRDLLTAGEQFLVTRASTHSASIIAGYHWFSDWGRDTMIALRGLCIVQAKQEMARSVMQTFLSYLRNGLLPNRFPDYEEEETEYNTADATLWLFIALYEYHLKFQDTAFIKTIMPALKEILEQHVNGTLHEIKVKESGLLHCGHESIQITWMDARLGEHIFTPRHGLPVEINALWYNALMIYQKFCDATGNLESYDKKKYEDLSQLALKNFPVYFWNKQGYLNDVVSDDSVDSAIRPNQVYALSLPFRLLSAEKEKEVLQCLEKKLLTPLGLRTLSVDHPDFKEKYEGNWFERDAAYHQGTVWPFLLPEFLIAAHRIEPSRYTKKMLRTFLSELEYHFYHDNCLYAISEVFDGLHPKEGKGCVQQAWSVANLILLLDKLSAEEDKILPSIE